MPAARRTESSVRVWIGRSCSRNTSAIAGQALERVVVAVGDRLVGDVAAGHHERRARVGEQQVVQRRVGEHHAEVAERAGRPRRDRRRPAGAARATIGRSRPSSSAASPSPSVDQRPRGRRGRRPSARTACPRGACARAARATAASSSARQARWKPPRPLTATIAPARSAAAAAATASPPARSRPVALRRSHARGPHAGQAFGWAWKRRSAGRRTRPAARAHRRSPAIVVSGRSYGHAAHDREARAAVRAVDERVAEAAVGGVEELGQAVVAGGRVGRDERGGVAARGARDDREAGARPRGATSATATRSTPASGGASSRQRARGTRRPPAASPSASSITPRSSLQHPARRAPSSRGEPVHVGAEADALHDALDARRAPRRRAPATAARASPPASTSSRSTW